MNVKISTLRDIEFVLLLIVLILMCLYHLSGIHTFGEFALVVGFANIMVFKIRKDAEYFNDAHDKTGVN